MREFLLIVLIIFCCCADYFGQTEQARTKVQTGKDTKSSSVTAEEYKIYLTVLAGKKGTFVISDKTGMDDDSKNFESLEKRGFTPFLEQINPKTKADFLEKNKDPVTLEKKLPPDFHYTFISIKDLKEKFDYKFPGDMNWAAFRETYPEADNLYTLSRVGFSGDGRQALVFVTNWCGVVCGEGNYFLLQKENDNWKVVNKVMTWIS
jgi:hypothetical protein